MTLPVFLLAAALRTLVYDVNVTSVTHVLEHSSGFFGGGGSTSVGSATTDHVANSDEAGKLTIEVIAATGDGGLAVDTRFDGNGASQPAIRIAISGDGRLSFAPTARPSIAMLRVLPLLARGLIAGRAIEPGASWDLPIESPARGTGTARVEREDGDLVTLSIARSFTLGGPNGFDEHDDAKANYDTRRLCPLNYELRARVQRRRGISEDETTTTNLVAKLASDSFGAPSGS